MGSVVAVALGGSLFALRSDHHTTALAAGQAAGAGLDVDVLVLAFQDTFRAAAVTAALGVPALALSAAWLAGRVGGAQGEAPSQ